jgi:hypothetical protein
VYQCPDRSLGWQHEGHAPPIGNVGSPVRSCCLRCLLQSSDSRSSTAGRVVGTSACTAAGGVPEPLPVGGGMLYARVKLVVNEPMLLRPTATQIFGHERSVVRRSATAAPAGGLLHRSPRATFRRAPLGASALPRSRSAARRRCDLVRNSSGSQISARRTPGSPSRDRPKSSRLPQRRSNRMAEQPVETATVI